MCKRALAIPRLQLKMINLKRYVSFYRNAHYFNYVLKTTKAANITTVANITSSTMTTTAATSSSTTTTTAKV